MSSPLDGWDADEREALREVRADLEALRARHDNDPPLELLRAGHHDALPADLQAEVSGFIAADAWSRALVEGLDTAETPLSPEDRDRLFARIRKTGSAPEPRPGRWRWLRPAIAASALAAVALALWTWRDPAPPSPVPSSDRTREVASAPPPVPAVPLRLDKPEMTLSAAALTWRGATDGNQLLADLKPPFDAFRQGDYARADRAFATLEPRYPSAVEVFYYGGVARLFLNDDRHALESLETAARLADTAFAPDVEWYRAIAEHRTGRPADARARLDTLCRGTSQRAPPACEALKQLGAR